MTPVPKESNRSYSFLMSVIGKSGACEWTQEENSWKSSELSPSLSRILKSRPKELIPLQPLERHTSRNFSSMSSVLSMSFWHRRASSWFIRAVAAML